MESGWLNRGQSACIPGMRDRIIKFAATSKLVMRRSGWVGRVANHLRPRGEAFSRKTARSSSESWGRSEYTVDLWASLHSSCQQRKSQRQSPRVPPPLRKIPHLFRFASRRQILRLHPLGCSHHVRSPRASGLAPSQYPLPTRPTAPCPNL